MKILVDTAYLMVATTGVKTYVNELAAAIKETGTVHKYHFFPPISLTNSSDFFKGRMSVLKKVIFHASYFLYKQLFLPIYCVFTGHDVLLSPDYFSPRFLGRRWKVAVIHDAFFWDHPQNYSPRWLQYFKKQIVGGTKGKAVVITTSHYAKKRLETVLPTVPIKVAYQSAEHLSASVIEGDDILERHNLEGANYLLHVGYFDRRKNLPTLIKAYARIAKLDDIPQPKLVLVGDRAINDALDDYPVVRDLIEKFGLQDSVVMTGRVSARELQALYSQSLAYVFPSYDEGFGIPILEAMLYKLPVIVSDRGALSEIAGEAALVFNAFDEVDLSEKITSIIRDQSLRLDLIEKGNQRLKDFSRKRFIQEIEAVIDQDVR